MREGPLDLLLDRAVVTGYSRIGYQLRRWRWDALAPDALAGRRVLVTGGTSGLGLATAAGCARLGATVHLLGRDRSRGEQAAERVREEVPGAPVVVEECDLGDLAAVAAFAEDLRGRVDALHGLVHNAGLMVDERTDGPDGHELTATVHVLGPHLLTRLLRPVLPRGSRVVVVSSGGMYAQALPVGDLDFRLGTYSPVAAYARAKRMQVVMTERWARDLEADGITVHAMHPGWADTPGVRTHLPRFHTLTRPILRTAEEGADTIVWLVAAPRLDPPTGGFWHDRAPRPTHWLGRHQESADDAAKLAAWCDQAVAAYVD